MTLLRLHSASGPCGCTVARDLATVGLEMLRKLCDRLRFMLNAPGKSELKSESLPAVYVAPNEEADGEGIGWRG